MFLQTFFTLTAVVVVLFVYIGWFQQKGIEVTLYLRLKAEDDTEEYLFWKRLKLAIVPRIGDTVQIGEEPSEAYEIAKVLLVEDINPQITCKEETAPREQLPVLAERCVSEGWYEQAHNDKNKTSKEYLEDFRGETQ